jgi:hypothetical protein
MRLLRIAILLPALLFVSPVLLDAADMVSVLEKVTAAANSKMEKTPEGIKVTAIKTGNGRILSQGEFKAPLVITARVKIDSDEIRLFFAKGEIILGWSARPGYTRFHDPKTGQTTDTPIKGAIKPGTWINVEWAINKDSSTITVDGEKCASFSGDFSDVSGRVGVGTTEKRVLIVKSLDVAPLNEPASNKDGRPNTNIARNAPASPSIEVKVPSQKITDDNKVAAATFDPAKIERPEYKSAPKSIEKSLTSITALVVLTSGNDEITGRTADIIATVPAESRQSDKAGAGFFRPDGDDMMKTAFEEAVRAVTMRYPLWEPGHIDVSFGEKSVGHAGPSAGTAFALLMLSCLEGFDIDPRCAVTGDISVDWKVRIVGGVGLKLRGAYLDKCLYAAIPEGNELAFADMGVYNGHHAWWDLQVFSVATLQEAEAVVRQDRPEKLAEAIKRFAELQPQFDKAERATLQKPETIATLKHILELAPNHLSARHCLALAEGTAPKTLSLAASTYHLGIAWSPFREWFLKENQDKASFKTIVALTRKRLDTLRPILDRSMLPLLTDQAAFIETLDGYADGRINQATLRTRYDALNARAKSTFADPAVMEKIVREGY